MFGGETQEQEPRNKHNKLQMSSMRSIMTPSPGFKFSTVTPSVTNSVINTPATSTTHRSKEQQANQLLYKIDLALQDMLPVLRDMEATLFGTDNRARMKLKKTYQDHIKVISVLHEDLEDAFKRLQIAREAKTFQLKRKKKF